MALSDRIIGVESGGDATARNPRSSATGAGQFISSTWLDMLKKHRPDIQGSREELLALRNDPVLSKAMTEAYATDNAGLLSKAGLPVTPATQYLAHFAGPQGAIGVLSADPSLPAGGILGQAAVKANPFLAKMTAGDLAAWANKKMGGPPVSPQPQAAPQQPVSQPAPASPASPPQAVSQPIFAQAQQAPPPMQFQPIELAPMQLRPPPRRPIDLSRLRAALQQGPHSGAFSLRG